MIFQTTFFPRVLCIVCLVLAVSLAGHAQDRCGFVEVMQNLHSKKILRETDEQFEAWMQTRKTKYSARENGAERYRIPVVVHVIHRDEAVGTGTNISDAQIVSQIGVLNQDFTRANADAANTPAEFQSVAGGMNIEFVLARQTPDGQPTTGIVRARGSKTSWSINDDAALKATSYWPAEDYLNIWVTNLSSTLLGYAQFPVSSGLSGLQDAEDNRLTDGVVIDYTVFGSIDDGAFSLDAQFEKGRTATHEIGHYLGLRHIWGDDGGACGGSGDYVADTPDQGNSTSGCPSNPQTTCSVHKMFQNYMDYTNDACMNLFTQQQVARMVAVMDNSPRRVTLPASKGLIAPVVYTRNLELTAIASPANEACAGQVTPQISVTNNGSAAVTSARIQLSVNGTAAETQTITFGTPVVTQASASVTFDPVTVAAGSTTLVFQILTVNGSADENAADNTQSVTVSVPYNIGAPFTETFGTWPVTWKVANSDEGITWASTLAPAAEAGNRAASLNFYNYQNAESAVDVLVTPVFDLSAATSPYLTFDVAYASLPNFSDGLQVYVLTQCGSSTEGLTPVYAKAGTSLATAPGSGAFVPAGASQWRREIVDLRSYIGQAHVQLAFYGINDGGNNLYLDNIAVVTGVTENVGIVAVAEPSPVQCAASAAPVLRLHNHSAVAVTSLKITCTLNGGTAATASFDAVEGFAAGAEKEFTLPPLSLEAGKNTLVFEVSSPNGYTDIDPTDNTLTMAAVVSTVADVIPLREPFNDGTFSERWTTVNPLGGMSWTPVATNYDQSVSVNSSGGTTSGDEAWLVSPSLDLSGTSAASLFFDLSYWYTAGSGDRDVQGNLKVLASTDCGVTYNQVLFDKSGDDLSTSTTAKNGTPASADSWEREYINLNALAGYSTVRIAFVFTNDLGSSIYLDNIEFFVSDNPAPKTTADPFIVYGTDLASASDFYVTFNLGQRQPVSYQLVDVMGKQVMREDLADVLNQTYRVEPANISSGVYILRLQIGTAYYSTKVYVGR